MRHHLLVTNDFPPKVGGIQNYLWDLWSRLDPTTFTVLTASSDSHAADFDRDAALRGIRIVRVPQKILFFPTPKVRARIEREVASARAGLVIVDPSFPLGAVATALTVPTVQLLHGAEVSIPGRLPVAKGILAKSLRASAGIIAAGPYPEAEARRATRGPLPPVLQVPPGVDTSRFVPLDEDERRQVRSSLGLPLDAPLVVSISRLVPRKGMDTLIRATSVLRASFPDLVVAIGGSGRDEARLRKLAARERAPIRFLGRVPDEDLPGLVAAADLISMACRSRWLGLEQEGFGIVFVEAAAAGTPQVAGRSGGSADAVVEGETGLIVSNPDDPRALATALGALLSDPARRRAMGDAGRRRAVASFDYDVLARRLGGALGEGWPLGQSLG